MKKQYLLAIAWVSLGLIYLIGSMVTQSGIVDIIDTLQYKWLGEIHALVTFSLPAALILLIGAVLSGYRPWGMKPETQSFEEQSGNLKDVGLGLAIVGLIVMAMGGYILWQRSLISSMSTGGAITKLDWNVLPYPAGKPVTLEGIARGDLRVKERVEIDRSNHVSFNSYVPIQSPDAAAGSPVHLVLEKSGAIECAPGTCVEFVGDKSTTNPNAPFPTTFNRALLIADAVPGAVVEAFRAQGVALADTLYLLDYQGEKTLTRFWMGALLSLVSGAALIILALIIGLRRRNLIRNTAAIMNSEPVARSRPLAPGKVSRQDVDIFESTSALFWPSLIIGLISGLIAAVTALGVVMQIRSKGEAGSIGWQVLGASTLLTLLLLWAAVKFFKRSRRPFLKLTQSGLVSSELQSTLPWGSIERLETETYSNNGFRVVVDLRPGTPLPAKSGWSRRVKISQNRIVITAALGARNLAAGTVGDLIDDHFRSAR